MWLAQALGGIAFLIGVKAFWQKDDMRFRYHMMVFCGVMALHFALMSAAVAAIGVTINGVRIFASTKTQSRRIMWLFIALMWGMTLPYMSHLMELLTVLGSSVGTWALFSRHGIALRAFILFNSCCWFSHNLWLGSIGGSLVEGTFIITNLVTIYKLFQANRSG